MSHPTLYNLIGFLLFLATLYALAFVSFYNLGEFQLYEWDESLFALRSLYIVENGTLLENFDQFEGLKSHINTKLPFTTLTQVLTMEILGVDEFSLRFPISLIVFLGVLLFSYSYYSNFKNFWVPALFTMLIISSAGFSGRHMLRCGDQDVALATYLFLASWYFYLFSENSRSRHLTLFAFFLLFGMLTKNLFAGIIVPGILMYLLITGKWKALIKDSRIYYYAFGVLGIFSLSILALDLINPGYAFRVWEYELSGRFSHGIEGHTGPIYFYLMSLLKDWMFPHFLLMIPAVFLLFDKRMEFRIRNLMLFFLCIFAFFLLIISISQTKTFWYGAFLYLPVGIIIAVGTSHIAIRLGKAYHLLQPIIFILIAYLLYVFPFQEVVSSIKEEKPDRYEKILKFIKKERPEIKTLVFSYDRFGEALQLCWYEHQFEKAGYEVILREGNIHNTGEHVLRTNRNSYWALKNKYNHNVRAEVDDLFILKITE